ncbi:MAG: efflux RND transporter permease subunit [Betaproteobacteria bacterium]|nr:efflux RND transporter permease subunit [Betaproteobacteria bacterium]
MLHNRLIGAVARRRVAPNVLMIVFILAGIYALAQIKTRFFPPFLVNTISVSTTMEGLAAADAEEALLVPLENSLRSVPGYEKIYGYAREDNASVVLEFPESTDMDKALSDVKAQAERARLPQLAENVRVTRYARSEDIAKVSLSGANESELRSLARRLENDLNARNIGKVSVSGIPEQEIQIRISQQRLLESGLTFAQIGQAIRASNQSASAGSFTGSASERSLRVAAETGDAEKLLAIPIAAADGGGVTYLRDLAVIERVAKPDQVEIIYNGKPAVEFDIKSGPEADILTKAELLHAWLDETRLQLPDGFELAAHDEDWRAIKARRDLLAENGITGLVLVLAVLFVFLSVPVAFWVAAGIPVAMLATLFVFESLGGSLNMISMFALIMAVGIIVDDAIVVGENAQYRIDRGERPMDAVINAAHTMFVPIFASSVTTIIAFLPLFLLTGAIGGIIFDIPMVIVCIIIAALLECFLILPGHLYFSFVSGAKRGASDIRRRLDGGFASFRDNIFKPIAQWAVQHSSATIAATLMLMFLAVGLMRHGFVDFRFFPGAERSKITLSAEFFSGTPRRAMEEFVGLLLAGLPDVEEHFGAAPGELVLHTSAKLGGGTGRNSRDSDQNARIDIELVAPDQRDFTASEFSRIWRQNIRQPAEVEKISLRSIRHGSAGQDIRIRLSGADLETLKLASLRLQKALVSLPGVRDANDDIPYGNEQLIFSLTPLGKSLNLNMADIAAQLRHVTAGFRVQTLTEGIDEVDVQVLMEETGGDLLRSLNIQLPSGAYAQLADIVSWEKRQGFDVIPHENGATALYVEADLEENAETPVAGIIASLEGGVIAELRGAYGVEVSFAGSQSDQRQTMDEMLVGLAMTLLLTYIVLTLAFSSWSLPAVVMLTMPMGVIGTIFGHWIMDVRMSILSLFGMFTLMGIIVNDSIVLVRCFLSLNPDPNDADSYRAAIVEAACQRLRAVLLTSLTTIGGLLPLLFETSLQAQFLVPMAVSICFGLAFATVLILLYTPACIAVHGAIRRRGRRAGAEAAVPA